MKLSPRTLPDLDDEVAVPSYDRSAVQVGIVHLGVGAFHRSHQAMYVDRLLEAGEAREWGIAGVGLLPGDARMRDALDAQDGLYTLVVKHPDGRLEPRVIGSLLRYLFAPDDPEAVLELLAAPSTRIVSLTVTEGGYNIHPQTGEFDLRNPAVQADLADGAVPTTSFAFVAEAARRRRDRGVEPFTVMSCDNIPGNGDVAKRMFTAFAQAKDPQLAEHMRTALAWPNCMVDRITPVTSDHDRELLAERFGVEDAWPVVCEPFTQWALEDHFPTGRPPLEDAGVQLVPDVEPYELMKLRLLNASHQALCYLGYLAGYRYAHEVCQDQLFVDFLLRYMDDEATPTLQDVPGIDLHAYKRELVERFANPEVRDTLARLCAESSDRIPKWLLPVIREELAAGGPIACATLVVAAWARYAEGRDEQGEPIEVVDQLRDRVMANAAKQVGPGADPTAFVQDRELFGDLVDDERFRERYVADLASLHELGARATLERLARS